MTELQRLRYDDAAKLEVQAWADRTPHWKRRLMWWLLNMDYCWSCHGVTRWRTVCWNPIHPDGPPLFGYYVCRKCGAKTETDAPLLRQAAEEMRDV